MDWFDAAPLVLSEGGGDAITQVVLIGDSITERSFGRSLTSQHAYMTAELGVPVYGYGWSGDRIVDTATRASTALSTFTSPGTLFVLMTGMNDVRDHRPLSGGDVTNVTNEYASLLALFAGRRLQVAGINYAHFGNNIHMLQNEHEGVRPFNDVLYPQIPTESLNTDGNPVVDVFNWTRNTPSLLDADGFHLSTEGEAALRDFYVDRLKWLIDGAAKPAPIPELPANQIEPGIDDPDPEGMVIAISFQHRVDASAPVNTFHRDDHLHSGNTYALHDVDQQPTPVTIQWLATTSSTGSAGIGANASGQSLGGTYATQGLLSDDFTLHSWFAAEGQTLTHRLEGLTPNAAYTIEAVGALNPSQPYPGTSSLVQGGQSITWNHQATPAVHTMTGAADATGRMDIVQEGVSGWNFVGGLRISGDASEPPPGTVEFVDINVTGGTAAASQPTPSGASAGDMGIWLAAHFANVDLGFASPPAWLTDYSGETAINNNRSRGGAGILPSVPQTVSVNTAAHHMTAMAFSGAKAIADPGWMTPGIVSSVDMPAKTITRAGSRVIFCVLFSSGIAGVTLTPPAGFSEIPGSLRTSGFPGRCFWMSDPLPVGTVGPLTFTWSTAVNSLVFHAILES